MFKSQARSFLFTGIVGILISYNSAMSSTASLYKLPPADQRVDSGVNTDLLKQLSAGVSSIAEASQKGLVYISVSKTLKAGNRGRMVDPFEFFFGIPRGEDGEMPKQEGLGSGFIVDLDKGYVLTNNHVVGGADEIQLKFANGMTYRGKVVGTDPNTDIAVVQVQDKQFFSNTKGLSALVLGDSDKLKVGGFVIALGAPFRLEASVSFGVVSAMQRGSLEITRFGNFIQTDTAINPGNSGGPMIDMEGKVVGINTAIFSKSGAYNGIGFAIPSNLVREVALSLINTGNVERGYLGVSFDYIQPGWVDSLKLPKGTTGVIISQVAKASPAEQAGIEPGDVITEVDDHPIRERAALQNAVGMKKPGTKVKLTVFRNGRKQVKMLELGRWPGDTAEVQKEMKAENDYGLIVQTDKDPRTNKPQVVIAAVEEGSAAELAGLQKGDVVTHCNGEKVESAKIFNQKIKGTSVILLHIEREGKGYFTPLHAPEKKSR